MAAESAEKKNQLRAIKLLKLLLKNWKLKNLLLNNRKLRKQIKMMVVMMMIVMKMILMNQEMIRTTGWLVMTSEGLELTSTTL